MRVWTIWMKNWGSKNNNSHSSNSSEWHKGYWWWPTFCLCLPFMMGIVGIWSLVFELSRYEIVAFSIAAKVSSRCKLFPFTCTHHPTLTSFCFKPSSAFHHMDNLAKPFDSQLDTNIHRQTPIANWRCFL